MWLHTQPLQHVAELTCFRVRNEKWARNWISKLHKKKIRGMKLYCLRELSVMQSCRKFLYNKVPTQYKGSYCPFITIPAALQGRPCAHSPLARTLLRGQRQPEKNIAIKGRLIIALFGTSLAQESAEIKGVQRRWRWLQHQVLVGSLIHGGLWGRSLGTGHSREISWRLLLRYCTQL